MEKSPEAFRTISEVAEWLNTPAHVLRFWESRFTQVKPVKRAGGRRYYRPADMALLGGIKKLLHEDGMTIRGVQKILRSEGVRHVAALSPPIEDAPAPMLEDAVPEAMGAEVLAFASAQPGDAPTARENPEPGVMPAEEVPEPEEAAAAAAWEEPVAEAAAEPEEAAAAAAWLEPAEEQAAASDVGGTEAGAAAPAEPDAEHVATPGPAAAASPPEADRQARFEFDAGPAPAAEASREPEESARPAEQPQPAARDLPELPPEADPAFAPRPSPFPLRDPKAARARLAGEPALSAALYARLQDLRVRMDARPL